MPVRGANSDRHHHPVIFKPTTIDGVVLIDPEPHSDERGLFVRTFCDDEFAAHGLDFSIVQTSLSFNPIAGTLRGMHHQAEPEPKLIRCTRGHIFDVVVDLRPSSPTYCKWTGIDLDAELRNSVFIPAGCAHGFLTITHSTEVAYSIGAPYVPDLARGVRWDDPLFGIAWPSSPAVISERDATFPDFDP